MATPKQPAHTPPPIELRPPERAGGLDDLIAALATIVARVCAEPAEKSTKHKAA